MAGASTGLEGCPYLQNPPALTGLQHDGQADAPSPWPSDDASRRRIFERECPYYQGDASQELPMFRFVEHLPGSQQLYIGDSYGDRAFICFDEDKPCSCQCDCRGLGSQPNDFAFIATKTSTALSIAFCDSALEEAVAAILGETVIPNTEAWAAATFDGLAILEQYAPLKQRLEVLEPSLAIVPALRLLVDGFLADGHIFKKFGYNDLFERGYLSLELWKEFQHRQLDDDITLLDDTFSAVAEERSQDNLGDAAVDEIPAVEYMPLHPDIMSVPNFWFEEGFEEAIPQRFEFPPPWMISGRDDKRFYIDELVVDPRLTVAARRGLVFVVQLLLDRGADVNVKPSSETPLLAAVEEGHESVARLLLDRGARINCVWGKTPLLAAVERGHESMVRLLLDRGADTNPEWRTTPLLAAVERGHESMVRLLLDRGADVNYRWALKSPLMAAVEGGHESLVRLLADRGAGQHDGEEVLKEVLQRGWNETAHHLFKLGWRSPTDRALVVRMFRELRNQKEAANRQSHLYMTACYNAFVEEYGKVKSVTRLRRDELVDMSIHRKCLVAHNPGWKFNESVRAQFADYRAAWQSGIRTLRRVSGGQLPEDPGEMLAFLCVCKAVSDTLDFFTGSGYTRMFFADLGRWAPPPEDGFDCYSHLIRRVWGIHVTDEWLSPFGGGLLLQYAQGLVSSLVGAASGLIRPTTEGGRDGLEESQLRWLGRDTTQRDVENDRRPVGRGPPDNPLLETLSLSEQILPDTFSARTSWALVKLMTSAAFAIILIFLLWLRVSIQGIQAAPLLSSLRLSSLRVGGVPFIMESCMVLEAYLGLYGKAHEFAHSWAPSDVNTPSPPEEQAFNISPPQPGDAQDNANGPADLDSFVQQTSTSVFSAQTGEVGRRNNRSCDDCQLQFSTRSNYLRHRRERHNPNKVVCPLCGKKLARPDYLATHLAENKCRNRRKGGRLVLG